ncbi:MAG TPA: PAS domain S-box protein, partial [Chitinophaga sp.]
MNIVLPDGELQRLAFAGEPHFRQVLTILPVAIYTVDHTGLITFFNDKAMELWGRAPEAGEYWCGALHAFHTDGITPYTVDTLPIVRTVREGQAVNDEECIIARADGSRRRVIPHLIPLFHPDGTVSGAINMMFDVTAQRASEAALADKEAQLRHATEAGNLGTFNWDLRTNEVQFSDSMAQIFGRRHAAEITHELLISTIHPDDQAARAQAFERAYQTGRLFYVVRLQLPDGTERWLRVNGRITYDAAGQPERMHGLAIDVTEQKNSELALRESEARLRLAIDAAEMGTWVLDLQSNRLHPSDRYRDILGTDNDHSWHLDDLLSLIHVNDRQTVHLAMRHALHDGRLDFEVRLIRPDGHLRWIKVNGVTTYNAQHQAVRIIGTVMNITEQRMARRELEALVQARTKALQESNELLEKSNNALAQFAYIASHDLQEPLRKIQTFADLLGRNLQDADTAGKYLEKIVSSAQRMSGLIKDVL